MTRHGYLALAVVLLVVILAGCASTPVVTAVDTLCVATSRYHATDAQVAAFKGDQGLWQPLVDWLSSFNIVRDKACLMPKEGP